jgi:hypothetical protein
MMASLIIHANVHLMTHRKVIIAMAEDNGDWKLSELNLFSKYLDNRHLIQCEYFANEFLKRSIKSQKNFYINQEMKADRLKAKLFEQLG